MGPGLILPFAIEQMSCPAIVGPENAGEALHSPASFIFNLPGWFKGKTYRSCFLFPFVFSFLSYNKGGSCFLFFSSIHRKKLWREHTLKSRPAERKREKRQRPQAGHCVHKQGIFSAPGTVSQAHRNQERRAALGWHANLNERRV